MKRILFYISLALIFSCKKEGGEDRNLLATKGEPYVDRPFAQEYHEGFVVDRFDDQANEVRAIQPDLDGNIWIATKKGILRKEAGSREWRPMLPASGQGPAYDVTIDGHTLWAATWNGVYALGSEKLQIVEGPEPPIAKIVVAKEGVYALGPKGIWLYSGGEWIRKEYKTARSVRAALSDGEGGLWVGTDVGLYHCTDEKSRVYQKNGELISAYVRGMDFDPNGHLWVGGLGGVTIRDQVRRIGEKRPEDGITNAHVNVVKTSPDGKVWVGTDYGITRFDPLATEYSVRLSKRWLLSDEVRDIAFDRQGNAWVATTKGVSAIKRMEMTLSEKAAYFYRQLIGRHVRSPWIVARSKLTVPGDTTSIAPDDDDNDGEFTANYLAMESFRYAVTKNPEAKERAKKAFDFLYYLREVTESDGFFARTVVPASWQRTHDMNRSYSPQEVAEELIKNPRQKPVEVRWHPSKDGQWKWKGDTSSDELCGHLFGYYWYYNLVADEKEKLRVADHFGKIMDHLIRNDFNLVDVDGTPTKWGIWSPKILNHDPEWAPERALNSLELLAFLKFAYHTTKIEKYQEEYLRLIREEGYLENAKTMHDTDPAWETYFDIYLALYLYPVLINHEDDPQLKEAYQNHMEKWFKKHKGAKSPFINFTYNLLSGGTDELDSSIAFLKDTPLDLVDWYIDNGKREDLTVVRRPILEELQVQLRPPSEYRTIRWDQNPYLAASGNPAEEKEPVFWLLPYWMGRYLNLIVEQ
ncbi:ligand-binding sensor domain-containing protein [Pseudozobellia thermophila]|uniref:Two component regulator propeller n=1 Tax=Pseudozobellia thermophila TaxID=192903 RepID=A0A1M6I6B2_9FLAO|nr:regulator [Pseudozobellia thermophila]SHJ29961.1 hypothetical protein SAMN04488513_103345 [Pseudozobellia thermophila]